MGDYNVLPIDDTTLETQFTCVEYSKVITDDNIYVVQTADGEYSIFLWKNKNTDNKDVIIGRWKGKSTMATSNSTAYLQIYNHTDEQWETLDSDNATIANTEFILTGTQSTDLNKYYDISYWAIFRIYQEAK